MPIGNFVIHTYQRYVSREYNTSRHAACVFSPSCSEYGREAMHEHGLVKGFIEGTMRMASCCQETRREHEAAFKKTLAEHDVAELEQIVRTETPHAHEALVRMKQLTDEEAAAPPAQKPALDSARQDIFNTVYLRHEEPVGAEHQHDIHAADQPHPNWVLHDPPTPYEPTWHTLNLAQKAFITVAGVAGATVVGAISAVVGLCGGLAGGAVVGVTAGAGRLPQLRERIANRYTRATLNGLEGAFATGAIGGGIYNVARRLHCGLLGVPLGVPIGLVTGMGIAGAGGAGEAGRVGWGMGKALGHNVARQILGVEPFARQAHELA